MLVAVIQAKNYDIAKRQINIAVKEKAECLELRLDYLQEVDVNVIAKLKNECSLPVIFTLRPSSQGGYYSLDEEKRLQSIFKLCQLQPDYFDLEYNLPQEFIEKIKYSYPQIKLICSYHNFEETPTDLNFILQQMQNKIFYSYKIATSAQSILDSFKMLLFVKQMSPAQSLTGLCMGELGQSTRILSPVVGNQFHYASVDETFVIAPGQLTINALQTIYHFPDLNLNSKIYALIGDPIDRSVGNILHNQAIQILKQNAIYIKLAVKKDELMQAIKCMRELAFAGLSITMPLKEPMASLVDSLDDSANVIRTINSVIVQQQKWTGFNTDGYGAIFALSKKINLSHQTIVILGAGGSAKAIAYVALQKDARVIILNRTLQKAKQLAHELGCEAFPLNQIAHLKEMHCSILINTLPLTDIQMHTLLKPNFLFPNIIAMDIVYQPINTAFLKIAKQADCICVPGYKMYIQQALLQLMKWFDVDKTFLVRIEEMMERYFEV